MLTQTVAQVLGGFKVVGTRPQSESDFIEIIRNGLPFDSVKAASEALELTLEEVFDLLRISKRTAARRKSGQERFRAEESERLFRLARLLAEGTEVLGSRKKGLDWLKRPNRALGDVAPLSLIDTDLGVQQVQSLLTRIAQGVIS